MAGHATSLGIQEMISFVDEFGVIRCRGHTNHDVPAHCPIILPMDHQFVAPNEAYCNVTKRSILLKRPKE